ncbi:MAG: hypothetical protein PUD20_11580 [bacterium]|nr:hypothetical protein [bacterium]
MRLVHIESRLEGQRDTDRQPEQSDGDTAHAESPKKRKTNESGAQRKKTSNSTPRERSM